jgi:hypothetical protein
MISLKKSSLEQQARIDIALKNLREKIERFIVVDNQGLIIGEVQDLVIGDDRQLDFVVSTKRESNQSFKLKSGSVRKIDSRLRCVFVDIDSLEIRSLNQSFENDKKESIIMSTQKDTNSIRPMETIENENNPEIKSFVPENAELAEEEIIRLLGEKIVVNRSKRKVGEVIVRKEIETRMVQIPVRREKLIVEQVNPEHKQLAEIDLGEEEIPRIASIESEKADLNTSSGVSVGGEFNSPKTASLLLNAIALERNHGCQKVKVTIVVENEEYQKKYQEWFARTSTSQQTQE